MAFRPTPSDPFYELMKPPVDETPAQTTARLKREDDAQRVNDAIDEDIKRERAQKEKEKNIIRVLLLGQSESGKSTTLKNFQIKYARTEWEQERNSWRVVVQLNIVRTVLSILKVIEGELNGDVPADSEDDLTLSLNAANEVEAMRFTDRHQLLIIRLAPLYGVEAELKRRLGTESDVSEGSTTSLSATPFEEPDMENPIRRKREFSVRSWKVLDPVESSSTNCDTATTTFAECKEDMKALWEDRAVRLVIKKRRLQLPDSANFFLNDLDRIASRDFVVTDDDIVRARLRTVGIQEHKIIFQETRLPGRKKPGWEWRIFDVGGCRTARKAWLPYFDNVNVIIFLSPVSVFDQQLEEDRRVNRIEDSLLLWTAICGARLLSKTQLILFLNKCDLLRRKLKRGIKVKDYLPSYGDRPNTVMEVVKYFRGKFKDIQKQYSLEQRTVNMYPTTVTDTTATGTTLETVYDGVLRENLSASHLI